MKVSDSDNLVYTANLSANPQTYSLTASNADGSLSYYVNNTSATSPKSGTWVQNLVPNPQPTSTYWFPSATATATVNFVTDGGELAVRSKRLNTNAYALYGDRSGVETGAAGDTYTMIFDIKASVVASITATLGYGPSSAGVVFATVSASTAWQTFHLSMTIPPGSDAIGQPVYPKFSWASGNVADWFEVGKVMLTKGNYAGAYADGSSGHGWSWDGAANASSSEGPAV